MNREVAVSALYAALAPSVVKPHADVADIEADARATVSIALDYAARLALGRRNQAKVDAFFANRTAGV